MWISRYTIALSVSFFLALVLTPLVRIIALKLNFLDYPNERSNHAVPTAVLGGLAVYFAMAAGVFFSFYYSHALKVIVGGGFVLLLLGMIDDKKEIPATIKTLVILTLVVILSRFGVVIKFFNLYVPDLILTLFWVLFVISAINAIDNMDGLACGIGAIASALFFIASLRTQQYLFGIVSLALFGATAGFLPYNFKPAKIFLGNGGSFSLGFILASIAVMAEWSEYPLISYIIPVFILIVPIFDLSFVILWRFKKGITGSIRETILYSAKDHLSHRLVNLGLTERRAVVILYLLNISVGISAIIALPLDSFFEAGFLLFQAFVILSILAIAINVGLKDFER